MPSWLIRDDMDRRYAIEAVAKAKVGLAVTIAKPKRTVEQNSRWWSMLGAIEKSGLPFNGEQLDKDGWHEVILSGYLTIKKMETGRIVRGLEGEPVTIGRLSSTKLTTEQFSEMIEMTQALMDQNGIQWNDDP